MNLLLALIDDMGKKYEIDKILDHTIIETQLIIFEFESILTDYLNHGVNDANHVVLKERNKEEYDTDFNTKGIELREKLEKVCECLSKKKYTDEHNASIIFLDEIQSKDFFVCNIQVIVQCVTSYLTDVGKLLFSCGEEYFYNDPLIKGKTAFGVELLLDISEFLELLYVAKKNYYRQQLTDGNITQSEMLFITEQRPRGYKRKKFLAEEIYRNARNSLDRCFYYDDISYVPVALFQIRQSIEVRLWEILGISCIIDENDKPAKVTADKLMDIKGLDKNIDIHIKLSNLKLIHKWTNVYVHAAITHYYWQIYFASECIKKFIFEDAIAKDAYYEKLKDLTEDTMKNYGVKNIIWKKRMACISESQKKQWKE